jgi:protein-tyrosine kinase
MAPDPDHLIERAAARLRTAHGLVVPDQAGREVGVPGPVAAPPGPPASGLALRSPAPLPGPGKRAAFPDATPDPIAIPGAPGSAASGPSVAAAVPSAGDAAPAPSAALTSSPGLIGLGDLRRIGLVVTDGARNRVSEEYRIIADRLRRASASADRVTRNLVMVTSARPGEGKSFTALNLAASIARGRAGRVLLVDVDIGPNALTLRLGLKDLPGLYDLIADATLRPDPFVLETEIPGLQFLPIGHPARLRNSTLPFGPALERLGRRYVDSVIVLDTPPALSTSDPHVIAPHVAQVVLVVEAERTQRGEVEAALDLVRACPSVSAVLNKTRLSASHTFGARNDHYYATPS